VKVFSILKSGLFNNSHPQEDYFSISNKYPIFVVADGVALNLDNDSEYPEHSGAGEVAKIFCEAVIREAEKKYENFEEKDIKEIFDAGNMAALEYNISRGMTKETINYWDVDLFSVTTSFLLIKNNKAYWWNLCDSGVSLFNDKGKRLFVSPDAWAVLDKFISEKFSNITGKERIKLLHKSYRNAVDKSVGYGVVTGEETSKFYLNTGVLSINTGDLVFLYTDGFENYFGLKEFIDLFESWDDDLEIRLNKLISDKAKENLGKYGSEKTLIAVSINK